RGLRIGPTPPTVAENLVLITIALYAVGRYQTHEWHPARTSLEIPIALLLIAGSVGIAIPPDHTGALGIYRAYFIEPVILFYIAIDLFRTPQQFRVLLLGL